MRKIIDISSDFFEISENAPGLHPSGRIYYGGDQAWFEDPVLKAAGCGVIAATNVYIHGFLHSESGRVRIGKKEYMKVADAVCRYVRPAQIFGIPMGIWPSTSFIGMMKEFMNSVGERIGFIKFSPSSDIKVLTQNIIDGLNEGMPLFLLIGITSRFKNLYLEYPGGYRVLAGDASMHWVIVLGLYESDNEYYLKTSSWGGILYIKLSDWKKSRWPSKILRMKREGRI